MNLKVKNEFVEARITHPATGVFVLVKWIDPTEYEYYYKNGFDHLFDVVKEPKTKVDK